MAELDWNQKYLDEDTPWDIGNVSSPISGYFQNRCDFNQKILIPGAGNAYEAEWLWRNGFSNIWIIDIAQEPLSNFAKRNPDFPSSRLLCKNYFHLEDQFDLIIEQTFFCAIHPKYRKDYVEQSSALLKPNGKLVGLLFDFPLESGPPYGGSIQEYKALVKNKFKISIMERCYNSIAPRLGNELFIELIKNEQ